MTVQNQHESIAVIGGGIMGVAAAFHLAKSGRFQVTLIEKRDRIGGLDSSYEWHDLVCDRFYHVVLPTDGRMLDFLGELGLSDRVYWRKVRSGFFGRGRLIPLSSVGDFLRFPFLTLGQKIRLGLGILYSTRVKRLARLDGVFSPQWLRSVFGRAAYEQIWGPLLRSKLGDAAERTSAAFMWATIKRLYGARGTRSKQERMGYWRGGYHILMERARQKLVERGISVVTGDPVQKIEPSIVSAGAAGRQVSPLSIVTHCNKMKYDRILLTVPCPEVLRLMNIDDDSYMAKLRDVEYLGVICVLLVLRRTLSPYYTISLLDHGLPFTGIVETTNIIPPEELGGRHLVYLPKYVTAVDPLKRLDDDQLAHLFVDKLKSVFPDLLQNDILHFKVFREPHVQPIPSLHFLSHPIDPLTPLPHVYLANTAMIPDSLHNNNANFILAEQVAEMISGQS